MFKRQAEQMVMCRRVWEPEQKRKTRTIRQNSKSISYVESFTLASLKRSLECRPPQSPRLTKYQVCRFKPWADLEKQMSVSSTVKWGDGSEFNHLPFSALTVFLILILSPIFIKPCTSICWTHMLEISQSFEGGGCEILLTMLTVVLDSWHTNAHFPWFQLGKKQAFIEFSR